MPTLIREAVRRHTQSPRISHATAPELVVASGLTTRRVAITIWGSGMATPSTFGQALLRARQTAGFSQEALAARSGLSVRGISDLERGVRTTPRLETVRLLVHALGLSAAARADLLAAARPELGAAEVSVAPAPPARLAELPAPLTSLIDREGDIARLRSLLARPAVRLVTLTGPGGVGKTRLALATAEAAAAGFRDGVAFVDLAPIRDLELVASTVATALGLRDSGERSPLTALQDALLEGQLLLVLDNFEQVIGAAPFVSALLRSCRGIKVLVTSRILLHVSGEHDMPVSPLALPDPSGPSAGSAPTSPAVRLFEERASAVQAGFLLTHGNAPTVAEICRRVDGLPLAIELAAARSSVLSPAEILARLNPRLPMLRDGPIDQPDRLRTMYDAIGWSLDLLTPSERRLFADLAVFSGGFSLAAAEAVWEEGTNEVPLPLELLGSLVDQSLVQSRSGQEGETRFGMLETIREVAWEELEAAGRSTLIRDRHAAYFGDLAERAYADLWGPRQRAWLNQLDTEHDNLRAALSWLSASGQVDPLVRLAGALGSFWLYRGHASEGRATLERALAQADSGDVAPTTLARALFRLATLLTEQDVFDRANELLERARVIQHELGDREGVGHVLSWLGAVAERRGDDVVAGQRYAEALAVFREMNDDSLISFALANLSDTAYRQGDLCIASELGRDALAAARAADDAVGTIVALGSCAQVELAEGHADAAFAALDESLTLSVHTGYQSGIANSLRAFAALALATRRPDLAVRLLGAAENVQEQAGIHRFLNQRLSDETLAGVGTAMAAADFAAAWAAGRALSLTGAIDEARSTLSN